MRAKSSSSSSKSENDRLEKLEDPHLSSGSYISSPCTSSSRTIDLSENEGIVSRDIQGPARNISDEQETNPQQQKKKVRRRRVQTSKPYQERLLNMAEARREIVSALKLHRAAMKKARDKQERLDTGPEVQPCEPESIQFSSEQEDKVMKSRINPNLFHSISTNTYSDKFHFNSSGFYYPYSRPDSSFAPRENIDFVLPTQTLGLNLNLQDFNILENNSSSIYLTSSPSTTSSDHALSAAAAEGIPATTPVAAEVAVEFGDSGFLSAMEISPIQSKDTLNSVEIIRPENQKDDEDFVNSPFDEVIEFPAWMNADHEHVDDFCADDGYIRYPSLPRMDIEEIEEVDGHWLA